MSDAKKISEIADISIGMPITRYKAKSIQDDTTTINYKLFSQNMLNTSGIFANCEADSFVSSKNLDDSCTKAGDVIYGLREPNQAVYISKKNAGLLVQSYMAIIRCDKNIILPEYLAFKLNTSSVQNQLFRSMQGSVIQLLQIRDLKNIAIDIPSIQEQKKLITILKTGYSEIKLLGQIILEKQKILKSII